MTALPSPPSSEDYIGAYAPWVSLDSPGTCLVLVDLQRALVSRHHGLGTLLAREGRLDQAGYRFSRFERVAVPNAARLLEAFRRAGLARVHLNMGSALDDYSDVALPARQLCRAIGLRAGTTEYETLDAVRPLAGEQVLAKTTMSAFSSTPLEALLRSWSVETLVFAGATTNMCVEHNVRDAADRGIRCVLVEDACATDSPEAHEAALRTVGRLYGRVATTEEVLAEIAVEAAHA